MSVSVAPLQPGELMPARTRNVLYALAMLNAAIISVTWPLLALLTEQLHITGASQGLFFALQSIGFMVSALWTGTLCDRFGKRAGIIANLALFTGGWLFAALHLSALSAAVANLLTGASSASLTAVSAYVGAHTEPARRSKAFAHMLAMRGLGQVAGPLVLAAAVVQGLGWVTAGLAAAGAVVCMCSFTLRESRGGSTAPSQDASKQRWLPRVPAGVLLPLLAMGLLWTSPGSVSNFVPIHAKESLGAGAAGLSALFSLLGLTMVLAPVVIWLMERWMSERSAARWSYGLMAAAIACIAAATSLPWLIAGYVIWALMWDVAYPYVKAEMSQRAKPEEQASVQASEQFVTGALMSVVSPLAGALYAGQGASSVFVGAAVLAGIGLGAILLATTRGRAAATHVA